MAYNDPNMSLSISDKWPKCGIISQNDPNVALWIIKIQIWHYQSKRQKCGIMSHNDPNMALSVKRTQMWYYQS